MRDALPNASFIGFTGRPIELTDKNTRAVFGDYTSAYDIQRAVKDKATSHRTSRWGQRASTVNVCPSSCTVPCSVVRRR